MTDSQLDSSERTDGITTGVAAVHRWPLPKIEVWLAIALTLLIVALHVVRSLNAGGLWRDEAAVAGLATMPTLHDVFRFFAHEAFPLLFPLTVRGLAGLTANSDFGYRCYGLVVGIAVIGALWWNARLMYRRVPLLSLALLGLNGAFIQWGDSLRGYGVGTVFMLVEIGFIWRLIQNPSRSRFVAATIGAVISVQLLFHNPPLVLAVCLAGVAVALRRRSRKLIVLVLSAGAVAAVSLVPYWRPLQQGRQWDVLVRAPSGNDSMWDGIRELLSASGWSNTYVWTVLLLVALAFCAVSLSLREKDTTFEILIFCGVGVLLSLGCCVVFLHLLNYTARPWYFLAFAAVVATFIDSAWAVAPQRWAQPLRAGLAVVLALTSLPLAWDSVHIRQTNIDRIAAQLSRSASPDDLIVVSPWFMGITFERYFTGRAAWVTVPPLDFHKFHRYDLVQRFIASPNPEEALVPVEQRIRSALAGGHRVWVVGLLSFVEERPRNKAPELVSALHWSHNLALFLRASGRRMDIIPVTTTGPVNRFENLNVRMIEGWAGPEVGP